MKFLSIILMGVLLFALLNCSPKTSTATQEAFQFTVKSALNHHQEDAIIKIGVDRLKSWFPNLDISSIKLMEGNQNIPFQFNDTNQDSQVDELVLLINLAPHDSSEITLIPLEKGEVVPNFKKRTQAELAHKVGGQWDDRKYIGGEFKNVDGLAVPSEHTDHSYFIRYEGPGWESDLIGYRFYLDWRNATDIFGKKTKELVLQDVGQEGFDSYHEPADWGMDILKVGPSLGIGALGFWQDEKASRVEITDSINCRILENGVIESSLLTTYYGWQVRDQKTELNATLSIQAGSRLTRHDLALSTAIPQLCTGIVKHENGKLLQAKNENWAYLATWGEQSLANDQLGMAVIYRVEDLTTITADEHNHIVVFNADRTALTYYFLATWEQEPNGLQTEKDFVKYLDQKLEELNTPLAVFH